MAAWPALSKAIRRAVLAIVESSAPLAPQSPDADSLDTLHPGYEVLSQRKS